MMMMMMMTMSHISLCSVVCCLMYRLQQANVMWLNILTILVEILVLLFWLPGPSGRARGRARTERKC